MLKKTKNYEDNFSSENSDSNLSVDTFSSMNFSESDNYSSQLIKDLIELLEKGNIEESVKLFCEQNPKVFFTNFNFLVKDFEKKALFFKKRNKKFFH